MKKTHPQRKNFLVFGSPLTENKKEISYRTKPEPHNTQYLEAMAAYHFLRGFVKDNVVLDAGCGFGYGTAYLADHAQRIVGIDFSPDTIAWAQKKYPGKNISFKVADVTKLDFSDGYFDVVCLFEVIHGLKEYNKALAEIKRVLKKGGLFIVSTRKKVEGKASTPLHESLFTAGELKGLLLQYGFGNIEMYGLNRPKEVYALEGKLQKIRAYDVGGIKRIIPRKIISWLMYLVSKTYGITPPQKLTYKDFYISKDTLDVSPGFLAMCSKEGTAENGPSVNKDSHKGVEKISCIVGTKNAERDIRECLESVRWADEIIVVDDFSTDRTVEIAGEYTDNIYQQKFVGYAQQRKYALEKTSHRWVLSLDADERITPELREEIMKRLSDTKEHSGFFIRRLNIFLDKAVKHCGWYETNDLCLFDKERIIYDTTLKYLDSKVVVGSIGKLKNDMTHYTCRDISNYMERAKLWASLNAEDLITKKLRITFLTALFYFLFKPPLVFGYKYFIKGGYLDGRVGFLVSAISAYTYFLSYVKVWQKQHI